MRYVDPMYASYYTLFLIPVGIAISLLIQIRVRFKHVAKAHYHKLR